MYATHFSSPVFSIDATTDSCVSVIHREFSAVRGEVQRRLENYLLCCGVESTDVAFECETVLSQLNERSVRNGSFVSGVTVQELFHSALSIAVERISHRNSATSAGSRAVIPSPINRPMWNAAPVRCIAWLRWDWWIDRLIHPKQTLVARRRRSMQANLDR